MDESIKRRAKDEVNFLSGNRYIFSYQRNRVEFWTSSFTGKEVVKVNGKVVSQARSYRKKNRHFFSVSGQPLMLEISITSMLKGPVYCVLLERDTANTWQPVAAKKLVVWPAKDERQSENDKPAKSLRARLFWWLQFGFFFTLGIVLSRTVEFNTWEFWGVLAASVGLITLWEHYYKSRKKPKESTSNRVLGMYIEDISVAQFRTEQLADTPCVDNL